MNGAELSKNLKNFAFLHCSNLSFMGSQLIFFNSLIPICPLFFRFKRNLIHSFFEQTEFFWLLLKAGTGNIAEESWGMPGNHKECRGIMGNSEEYARNSGESRGMSRNIGE